MFVRDECVLPVGFAAARARLASLVRDGSLLRASHEVYRETVTQELRAGSAPGVSRLVRAQFRDLITQDEAVALPLRWEATGPGGALFPVLDANITLSAPGQDCAVMRLDGVFRPPLGVADPGPDGATVIPVRAFLSRVAALVAGRGSDQAGRLALASDPEADTS